MDIVDDLRQLEVSIAQAAADEIVRLRTELRRIQRLVIDGSDDANCEDLCQVLCAGPCQGID